ncbi:MAG: Gfo/Idh/MocA family oxidoreductase [Phycisphaerales bacterium]|nr:Gfo/Idh/MocA family oxidoreductase [Phycisphaerales bacterium]
MPVRYGIIGCGAIGQRRHIPEIAANKNAVLAALCDMNQARVEEVGEKYHLSELFTDYRQMLEQVELDAVVIGTPNYLHAPQTIDAFKAGKHVLVEKPMATTREEAKAMIAASKKAKKFLMIGLNQRFMPQHVKARQIIKSGRIGNVLSFRTAFKHRGPESWCIENSNNTWFFRKKEAVLGVTGDLGIHKADLMRYLLGEDIASISGILTTLDKRDHTGKLIQTDDNALLTCTTTSGIPGSIILSWTNYGEAEANYTVLYGTQGVLMLATDPEWGVIVRSPNGMEERYKVGRMATNEKQTTSGVSDAFTQCLLKNKAPEVDGVEGYKSLDAILTAIEAAQQGRTLKVKNAV